MSLHTGTVARPRFQSAPYRQTPARREAIHGRVRPMDCDREPIPMWAWMLVVFAISTFAASYLGVLA